jgi:hypothetical protein
MINNTKEPCNAHKHTLKEEILQKISWRRYWTWLSKMHKIYSRHFMTTKIKNMRRHRNK